jgi:4-amino-4-deoxychorismate lyase
MIAGEVARLLGDAGDGVLKILVTRGEGGRGYAPPRGARPRRILTLHPLPEHPPEWRSGGVVIRICRTPATGNPALAGLKHLNRLDSVLARAEWSAPDIAEGILTGPEGEIIGGTMTNLFLWNGALLQTPAIDRCGVAGTVRALAMDLAARQGIPCVETQLSPEALLEARGAFLTNSVVGVWPVRRLEDRHYDPQDLPLDLMLALELEAENQEGGP